MKPENEKRIAALKQAIAWMEAQGDALPTINQSISLLLVPKSKDEAREMVRAMGKTEKKYGEATVYYDKSFGAGITVCVVLDRGVVCRRVVKGTHIEPNRIVEDVEWICDEPLLAGSPQ